MLCEYPGTQGARGARYRSVVVYISRLASCEPSFLERTWSTQTLPPIYIRRTSCGSTLIPHYCEMVSQREIFLPCQHHFEPRAQAT